MSRVLRGLLLTVIACAVIAPGCSEEKAGPKSFSKNINQEPVPNDQAKAKPRPQNKQVRSFMVPSQ
jgi:hypothetical protein